MVIEFSNHTPYLFASKVKFFFINEHFTILNKLN